MRRAKKYISAGILTVLFAGGLFAATGQYAAAQPGSTDDPLVSKSYVDNKINQVISMITGGSSTASSGSSTVSVSDYDEIVTDVVAQMEYLYGDKLSRPAGVSSDEGSRYVPVSASPGQVILGGEGTEIILRSGTALAYCPGENGLVDATDGSELFNNYTVKTNHIVIVPREDGRGVLVQTDAWFIIKGDYKFLGN